MQTQKETTIYESVFKKNNHLGFKEYCDIDENISKLNHNYNVKLNLIISFFGLGLGELLFLSHLDKLQNLAGASIVGFISFLASFLLANVSIEILDKKLEKWYKLTDKMQRLIGIKRRQHERLQELCSSPKFQHEILSQLHNLVNELVAYSHTYHLDNLLPIVHDLKIAFINENYNEAINLLTDNYNFFINLESTVKTNQEHKISIDNIQKQTNLKINKKFKKIGLQPLTDINIKEEFAEEKSAKKFTSIIKTLL
jgi:hypothetical protein